MHSKVELKLSYLNNLWIAENSEIKAQAKEISDLDSSIAQDIKQLYSNRKGQKILVSFHFDQNYFPEWIRQYSNHYFNRQLEILI